MGVILICLMCKYSVNIYWASSISLNDIIFNKKHIMKAIANTHGALSMSQGTILDIKGLLKNTGKGLDMQIVVRGLAYDAWEPGFHLQHHGKAMAFVRTCFEASVSYGHTGTRENVFSGHFLQTAAFLWGARGCSFLLPIISNMCWVGTMQAK